MGKRLHRSCLALLLLPLITGCWSSKEIEDLALYAGLALDSARPAPVEEIFEEKGSTYTKENKVMATVQIVPAKMASAEEQSGTQTQSPFYNVSGTGDSVLEIFRQFSIRMDRPIIGHHLKVIVFSAELLKQQSIEQATDFLLRDNDIRPSTMVFVSQGPAIDTLNISIPGEVPSFHIAGMMRNRGRTSKVLNTVSLTNLDALTHAEKSFVLQNIVTGDKETEFAGAAIIKGSTGHWIGTLNQEDTECLNWLRNEGSSGIIKSKDWDGETLTFEIKSLKSKITPVIKGDSVSFEVKVTTEGRLIETWNENNTPSTHAFAEKADDIVRERLAEMMKHLIDSLQNKYKAEVAGFGDRLAIKHPKVWRKLKDNWDETFTKTEVRFTYDVSITDFGSFTEQEQ